MHTIISAQQHQHWNAEKPSTILDPSTTTWLSTSPTNHRPANFWKLKKKNFIQTFREKKLWKVVQSIPVWTDIENPYRLSRASYIYIHKYIYIHTYKILTISPRCVNLNFDRVGDNRRTVNTLTTPHISDQLGTENMCETLWCRFIVMIWALVCDDMYRYGCHFVSFYHNPTILEMVSIAWVNTEYLFYWNTMTWNNFITNVSLLV